MGDHNAAFSTMPTYEYACGKCGHAFEAFQSMSDAPLKKCPRCKKPALKRLLGAGAGLIFKGSGFYVTDYKKKTGHKSDSTHGGGAKDGGAASAGTSSSSESKPASDSKSGGSKSGAGHTGSHAARK